MRLMLAEAAPRITAGGQRTDLDVRVREEEPEQLSPRVPAGTCDSYP
jgi:hypothetical protein